MTERAGHLEDNGTRLYFQEQGAGPTVVLLHAGLWDARIWDPQWDVFAERFHVVRYDQRGYGRSAPVDGPYSNVEDLKALLDALGLDRVALVGNSRGGRIAIDFTLEHPERVWALVPVAATVGGFEFDLPPEREAWWEEQERAVHQAVEAGDLRRAVDLEIATWAPLGVDDAAGRRILEIAYGNSETERLDDKLERRLDPPAAKRLGEIDVPTLVIIGAEDQREFTQMGEAMAATIRGARLEVIEDADHVVAMRQPDEFNSLVLDFLEGSGS